MRTSLRTDFVAYEEIRHLCVQHNVGGLMYGPRGRGILDSLPATLATPCHVCYIAGGYRTHSNGGQNPAALAAHSDALPHHLMAPTVRRRYPCWIDNEFTHNHTKQRSLPGLKPTANQNLDARRGESILTNSTQNPRGGLVH